MKAKLIKHGDYYAIIQDDKMVAFSTDLCTNDHLIGKLSKQNCDEIFGVVDVEKLAMDWRESTGYHDADSYSYILGFNKAIELNKDKVFTVEDVKKIVEMSRDIKYVTFSIDELISSLQQPTEIDVEIEMEDDKDTLVDNVEQFLKELGDKPKLDSEGCLILKRVV
jgi:hypothetical protein